MPAALPPFPPLPRVALTPRRWLTFAAHSYKAAAYQHHRELMPALRQLIVEDAVVFDIGAHSGQFATLFARIASQGTIYSFEPGRYARMILTLALAINRTSNVRVFPIALGDKAGPSSMRMPVKAFGQFRIWTRESGHRRNISSAHFRADRRGDLGRALQRDGGRADRFHQSRYRRVGNANAGRWPCDVGALSSDFVAGDR